MILLVGILISITFYAFYKQNIAIILVIGFLVLSSIVVVINNSISNNINFYIDNNEFRYLNLIQKYKNIYKKIFFVWVGKYPNKNYINQIQNAIKSAKKHNPDHTIFLFSNRLSEKEVDCNIIPIHYKSLFADSPNQDFKYAPYGECPKGYKSIKPALWSDAFRIVMLWKYGGSYIDIDDISIRSLPHNTLNIIPTSAIQGQEENSEYNGGISGKFVNTNYKWRFGNDPLINFEKGNPFLEEILSRIKDEKPVNWGQILPTKIFKENPHKWIEHISLRPWHDILYHPKHDGHTDFDKRYSGEKIKWNEGATSEKINKLLNNYDFPLVKNHNFCSDKDNSVLATLINKSYYINNKRRILNHNFNYYSENTKRRNVNKLYWTPAFVNKSLLEELVVPTRIFTVKVPDSYDTKNGSPDPFLVCGYIFAEIIKKGKGVIAVAKLREDNVLDFKPIIEEKFHLSYPNVFQYQNYWYMIPETYQSGNILLYRATNFPYKWERIKKIYELDGLDSTPFYLNNSWFIFTTSYQTQENHLLTTTSFPLGTWSLVKKGMLKKGYRGGGKPIYKDKKVILPLQPPVGKHGYGYNLELFTINNDLTFTHKSFINPPKDATGIHHLAHNVCSSQYIVDLREFNFKSSKNEKLYNQVLYN